MNAPIEGILKSVEDLKNIGAKIREMLPAGGTIALHGDLGAGKTTLVRTFITEIAEKNGKTVRVMSPTFPIHLSYTALDPPVEHFDLYRLDPCSESDLENIGFFAAQTSARDGNGYVFIEWPERQTPEVLGIVLQVHLKLRPDGVTRTFSLKRVTEYA